MIFKSVLLGMLAVSAASFSADAATPSRAATAAVAPPVPLMWKVSDADNDLYLLGSFHMLKPSDYPLSADVDAAFDDAEAMAFELSPQELQSPELGQAMGMAALRTDRTPLNSELPDATIAKLDAWIAANGKALQKMGMPAQALQMFEPWFVGLTISLVEMDKQGLDPEIGLDMHFIGRAQKASKPTMGLEKGSEQIAVFDGMTKAEQLQFLDESLNEAVNAKVEIEKLHTAWRRGAAAELLDGMAGDMRRDYPQLYRKINVARNDAWVPKLQRMLDDEKTDDTLVVVGALHLLGEDGVVEKLRAKGYKVERICSACAASKKR
ncbi:MAG: TraB/GumN family protein [Xanthomonadales bacterium]|nr:TraB/GumN family protein [Xanthomonadales bacterium]